MQLTYDSIKNYLLKEEQQGESIHCEFKVENQIFESIAAIQIIENEFKEPIKIGRMRSAVLGVLKRAVISKRGQKNADEDQKKFSKKEKELAVVEAFKGILDQIVYVETTGKWHLATEFSDFERRIRQNPLRELRDKGIMSRMLVEMARADGRIGEQERLFFEHFLNEETGRLADLMRAPVLTQQDCKEITPRVRSTIFMLVAAVALTDNEFNDKERKQLDAFATMLGFEMAEQEKLLFIAQTYTIEVAYKAQKGKLSTEELYTIANQIGMETAAADKAYKAIIRRNKI